MPSIVGMLTLVIGTVMFMNVIVVGTLMVTDWLYGSSTQANARL